ncbi:MAG: murein biosynthesis integral membrane protein MurJ [Rhodospirillales bacterium]|jgi:putative peptidoglycan lipid II flippase
MALLRHIVTVGGMTMVSRILGFVRDILIAAVLGAGPLADVFFVAFKLPNLFRRLFAEGAFSLAFVPLFAGRLEVEGSVSARGFAERCLSVLLFSLFAFVVVVEISMPVIMRGFAPGFVGDPERFDLVVLLTRITFPYLLFISLVSLLAGVLNSLQRFAAAAATPILLNLCLIGAILGLARFTESAAHALAWGVALAGALQFAWLAYRAARAGMALRLPWPRFTPDVCVMMRRIVPVAVGAGIYQINLVIDMVIATLLPAGSISYLFFADRVIQLPLGVIGVAVGTALLPTLSREIRGGRPDAAMAGQNRALEAALLLIIPAAAALVVIAGPVTAVLFERGQYGAMESSATAMALMVFALGLPAFVLVKVLAPGFYAREDTATPVKIAVLCMLLNLVLNLFLMGPFLHVGIAIATTVSSWLNALLLLCILWRRGHFVPDPRLIKHLPRMVIAGACMAAGLAMVSEHAEGYLGASELVRAGALAGMIAGGVLCYGVLTQIAGVVNVGELRALFSRRAT